MNKIKVLCLPSDRFGVGYFRSLNPHTKLSELYGDKFDVTIEYDVTNKPLTYFEEFDIIHFSKNISNSYDKCVEVLKYLKDKKTITVMDIDDYYDLGSFHPMSAVYKTTNTKQKLIDNIRMSDYVTTTTDIFANCLKKHNKNVIVLPNAIDKSEKQFQPIDVKSEKIRFGIICGSSHEHDINILQGLTNSLPKDILAKCQFVLCGFDTNGMYREKDAQTGQIRERPIMPQETVWYGYEKVLTDNYKLVSQPYSSFLHRFIPNMDYPYNDKEIYRRCWTKPINQYATHYNNIDVLLVPLKECDFNKYKSQLKVIEAGFFHKAIIAQNFGPYTIDLKPFIKQGNIDESGNGLLVESKKNHKQWAKYITTLVQHPEYINKMAENLYNTVKDKYSIETITVKRAEFYESIVNSKL